MALVPWPSKTATASLNKARAYLRGAIGSSDLGGDQVDRLGREAAAMVEQYAPGAPEAVQDEAVVRFAGYLAQSDFGGIVREGIGPREVEYTVNHASAFRNCGAAALLTRWRVRRAGVIGGKAAVPQPAAQDEPDEQPSEPNMPTKLPQVRFFRVELVAGTSGFPEVSQWTAQQWIDNASAEVPGATTRGVSMAAPVYCYQVAYHYPQGGTQYEWAAVAVPDGDEPPSHFRVSDSVQPDNWSTRWRQASGQAVIEGAAYDVYFWSPVVAAFPATLRFEWPLAA